MAAPDALPILDALLRAAQRMGASDLHLKAGSRPLVRVDGGLVPVPEAPSLSDPQMEALFAAVLAGAPHRARELADAGETDVAIERPGLGRVRSSLFRQRGRLSAALRMIPGDIPGLDDLGLPPAVSRMADAERGVILVTGTTGSGKSTTLAAIIDRINRRAHKHVVTIEDPIEMVHRDHGSLINQREVGNDTPSFATALRRVLRQDPDVIMLGEIRDAETMEAALQAAETGHLVLSTMHTLDATETVNRAIGFFPLHQQQAVRAMLAGTLCGIISQRLVPAVGGGRAAATEVLVATPRARDMVINAEDTHRLDEVIREGEYYGMQSFDQCLFEHVTAGRVSLEHALTAAASPHDLRLMLEAKASRRSVALGG